jgi:hypothetical protein
MKLQTPPRCRQRLLFAAHGFRPLEATHTGERGRNVRLHRFRQPSRSLSDFEKNLRRTWRQG